MAGFCRHCGNQVGGGARFCGVCGTAVVPQEHKAPPVSSAPLASRPVPAYKARQALVIAGAAGGLLAAILLILVS